jgi:formylglycine-generating enzyme required for sulfatase activity/serine/threonine protein kinase
MSVKSFECGFLIDQKYRLLELIGEGAMGQVWKAEDLRHDYRSVAIKFIAWQHSGDDQQKRERFRREMRALARLEHSHIVHLIEFDEMPDGTPYLVMSFVPGGSLQQRMEEGRLDAALRTRVLGELCDALDYVHSHNVVHRDLKPANILFDASNHVQITDFGLAKLVDTSYTASLPAGTPGFEAPEQTAEAYVAALRRGGPPTIDHRADIYALGVIAWLLFTGRHPGDPTSLPEGQLSPELEQVLHKAFAYQREDRYNSAGEFLEAVTSAIASERRAIPSALRDRWPLWAWGIAGGAILFLALAGVWLVGLNRGITSVPTPTMEQAVSQMELISLTATPSLPLKLATNTSHSTSTSSPLVASTPFLAAQPTASLTATPTVTPQPMCAVEPQGLFVNAWWTYPDQLGCPLHDEPHLSTISRQMFENGYMFWRKDRDQIYVIYDRGVRSGSFQAPDYDWSEADPYYSCSASPPEGRFQPAMGFGWVWCQLGAAGAPIGWALDEETYFDPGVAEVDPLIQDFERGVIFRDGDASMKDFAHVLFYGDGTYLQVSYPTSSPSPVVTSTLTGTSQPTATPACLPVTGPFAHIWESLQRTLGCASGPVIGGKVAEENFAGGKMLWREEVDHAQALVLFNDGTWQIFEHSPYVGPEFSCPDVDTPSRCPPTPKRGFGMIWCDIPEVRNRLGNAIDCEKGYPGSTQPFERGFAIQIESGIYIMYSDGHWERWRHPDGMTMVYIPAGEFQMGSDAGESDERPVHQVHLDEFWIDRFEVTNANFEHFVSETGYQTDAERSGWGQIWENSQWSRVNGLNWRHPRYPHREISAIMDHPVVQVSWYDASAYCHLLGSRLPSEAEWEMAAIGMEGWRYPWGDAFDPTRLNASGDGTLRVGRYESGRSPWGVYDMAGNVWEWVSDWYQSDYYASSSATNPRGPLSGVEKVLRGGGWDPLGGDSRSADRGSLAPERQGSTIGFRCAWSP